MEVFLPEETNLLQPNKKTFLFCKGIYLKKADAALREPAKWRIKKTLRVHKH